jgi:small subunit ribosomal protein S9
MAKSAEKYIESVGRRKTAIARVRLTPAAKQTFVINGKSLKDFFTVDGLVRIVEDAFNVAGLEQKYAVSAHVNGGGINGQAEAVRLGIARNLIKIDLELRKNLKKAGYLKRDPRIKERKKPGLKKARKAPQWSKR